MLIRCVNYYVNVLMGGPHTVRSTRNACVCVNICLIYNFIVVSYMYFIHFFFSIAISFVCGAVILSVKT